MKAFQAALMITIVLFTVSGCQTRSDDVRVLELAPIATIDQHFADEAKKIVIAMDEVIETKGVNFNKQIYLAIKVKQFDRFRLKEIRKKGHDLVKKRFPDAKVHLSTDKKIFMELDKLERKLKDNQIDEKQLEKELRKLEELMKG